MQTTQHASHLNHCLFPIVQQVERCCNRAFRAEDRFTRSIVLYSSRNPLRSTLIRNLRDQSLRSINTRRNGRSRPNASCPSVVKTKMWTPERMCSRDACSVLDSEKQQSSIPF